MDAMKEMKEMKKHVKYGREEQVLMFGLWSPCTSTQSLSALL